MERCRHCRAEIRIMIQRGSGFCSQRCARGADLPRVEISAHIYRSWAVTGSCSVSILRDGLPSPCGLPRGNPIHVEVSGLSDLPGMVKA